MSDGMNAGQPGEGSWQGRHARPDPASTEAEGHAIPHRVIGTPAPAESRTMISTQDPESRRVRELPEGPDDPVRAKKVERLVAAIFVLAFLAGCGFVWGYVAFTGHTLSSVEHSNFALGGTLAGILLLLGAGTVLWVRHLMPVVDLTEERHPLRSSEEDRAEFKETFEEGADASQFVKRPLLRRTLMLASLPLAVTPVLLLRDLGPLPQNSLQYTVWRKGLRLWVYGANRPITPAEFNSPGSVISIVPAGYADDDNALAKAAVIIIKFRPGQLQFTKGNVPVDGKTVENWTVDNIVAYSKICTHVGCPAALYEQTTHHILCPCHQSTFDATRGAKVVFGPASRPLPQLPITVDAQGYLVAKGDFDQPVGPSFWERGSFPQ